MCLPRHENSMTEKVTSAFIGVTKTATSFSTSDSDLDLDSCIFADTQLAVRLCIQSFGRNVDRICIGPEAIRILSEHVGGVISLT